MNPNPSSPDKITPDDPRLTAFALGELPPGEHAALAAAVAGDPALTAEVENIRALASQMRAALAAEPLVSPPALSLSKGSNQPAPAAASANVEGGASSPLARAAIVHPQEWQKPDAAQARAAAKAVRERAKVLRFPAFYWLATAAAACFALLVWVKNSSTPAKIAASRPQPAPATAEAQVAIAPVPTPLPPAPTSVTPPVARVESQIASAAPTPQSASPAIDQPRYQPGVTVAADGIAAPKDSIPAQPAAPPPIAGATPAAASAGEAADNGRSRADTFAMGGTGDRLDGGTPTTLPIVNNPPVFPGAGGAAARGGAGQPTSSPELPKSTAGTLTVAAANTYSGGAGLIAPGAGAAPGGVGPVARGGGGRGGRGGAGGGAASLNENRTTTGGGGSQGLAGNNFGGGFAPGAGAPVGRGAIGGRAGGAGGGRRAAAPVTVTANSPVVVRVGYDPDAGYRYPLPAPDVIIRRPQPPPPAPRESTTEQYARLRDNPFTDPAREPFSTFSADVDTASYANIRSFLQSGRLPPPDAVRIEELVNYFDYSTSFSSPTPFTNSLAVGGGIGSRTNVRPTIPPAPFSTSVGATSAPWAPSHRLVRVLIKARDIPAEQRPPANLVFLIDVSGSMDAANRLPLVKESLRLLLGKLAPADRVAIVTYANGSGVALPSTPVAQRNTILDVVDSLRAEGGTNGGEGIQLAYRVAQDNFNREGVNRIILCTDGDFNVGVTGQALLNLVRDRAQGGVFLTVLGFGRGNLKDATLEALADQGNGHYGYIDTREEAQKIFVEQLSGTLVTVAKDVKFQVEFNPARVAAYRLLGYEDRLLAAQDFNNDRVDAGEVGAGHTVTALYEVVPPGADYGYPTAPGTDAPRYTETTVPTRPADAPRPTAGANSPELLTVKIRFKPPTGDTSQKLEFPFTDRGTPFAEADADLQFAAAVAGFGMVLRDSPYRGGTTLSDVLAWAERGLRDDPGGHRAEFTDLVRRARELRREPVTGQPRPLNAPGTDAPRY